jgi:hypothetical protein
MERIYEIQPNDTLHSIAARIYGNGNRWVDIAKHPINIDQYGEGWENKDLQPGMFIRIPS